MASIDEKSFTVVSTVRYKKLYKKVVKGELTTEELYKECMKLGIKGKASVEIIKDKSREFAKQDFRVQDIRSVLLSVLFNESIPKFIHIKNKPYIRDVIVMNIQDIDDPDRELSELSSNDIYSIKISNSSDHSPRFSTKLLSYSNEETVDDNEQTVATTDPSNKYNQYILSESMLRFWGYPMPNLDNCLDQSCKRQRLEEMSALVTETETSGVSTGIIPSHSTTNQLIKLLQSIDVVMKDNTSSGFYRTLDRDGEVYDLITYDKSIQPFTIASIDCEMCDTTNNRLEVTRVSIVNENNVVLLDTLVKPSAPITNYRTEFSGITEELLAPVSVSLAQVQLFLLTHITSDSIIVGHSLDSDLKALKISHNKCIDTSIIYPHVRGHPYKYKLKYLANHYLQLDIQRSGRCHDSIEDASAAMQLVQMKVINGPSYGLPKQSNEKRLSIFSSTKSRVGLTVTSDFYCIDSQLSDHLIQLHTSSNVHIFSRIDECITSYINKLNDVPQLIDSMRFTQFEINKNQLINESTNIKDVIKLLTDKINESDRSTSSLLLLSTQPTISTVDSLNKRKKACLNVKSVSTWSDEQEILLRETINKCNIGHVSFTII